MYIKIFCIRFLPHEQRFDDSELEKFSATHHVLSVQNQFITNSEGTMLATILTYAGPRPEAPVESVITPTIDKRSARPDTEKWKELLTEADMPLFSKIRGWRNQRAKREGVPPYVLITNMQLATMIKTKPQSLAGLEKIEGIGRAKIERYGEDLLGLLRVDAGGPGGGNDEQP